MEARGTEGAVGDGNWGTVTPFAAAILGGFDGGGVYRREADRDHGVAVLHVQYRGSSMPARPDRSW